MKTIAFSIISVALLCVISCQPCKDCSIVTYQNGTQIDKGNPEEYCGSDLSDIEGQSDTVGNTVTIYECQ